MLALCARQRPSNHPNEDASRFGPIRTLTPLTPDVPHDHRRSTTDAALRAEIATASAGGPNGRAAHARLQAEKPPLLELMRRLDCVPPVKELADCLPPLAPRYYSITNAAAADVGKVHLCLSVVTYSTVGIDGTHHERSGLASNMIARLCTPLLDSSAPAAPVRLAVYRREPSGNEL